MHGTSNGDTQSGQLERICLSRLFASSAHPVRLYGRFHKGELVFVTAPDPEVEWPRAAGQSAEEFEDSVIDALLELRGLPTERRGQERAFRARGACG